MLLHKRRLILYPKPCSSSSRHHSGILSVSNLVNLPVSSLPLSMLPSLAFLFSIKSWPGWSISCPGSGPLAWITCPPWESLTCRDGRAARAKPGATFRGAEPLAASRGKGQVHELALSCEGLASHGQRGLVPTTHVHWTNALASPAWAESRPLPDRKSTRLNSSH